MLAQVGGGDNHLGLADVVVLEEDDLEQVTNLLVLVDDSANVVDQVNDLLGHPVAGSSLSTKDGDARRHLLAVLGRHGLERQVSVDDAKDVHLLALVLVDSLDLDVEERGGIDTDARRGLDVLGQAYLVGVLDLRPLLAELLVVDADLELVQLGEVLEELVAARLGSNELRQAGVGLVQPASRGDAVCDVGELVGAVDVDKVLEDCRLDEVRVQLGDTVDLVGADNGQEGHADHLGLRLFYDRDPAEDVTVVGEHLLDALEEEEVDVVDDLQVSGQQVLDQTDGPLLEGLGQDGVVGVAKRGRDEVPRLIPLELLEVDKDALELDNGQRRVRVVQLDGDLVGELPPGAFGLLETTDNVVEGRGHPEVLLLQAELLSTLQVVVGVEDGADRLGTLLVGDRVFIVTAVEFLEVKLAAGSLAGPQT